MDVEKFIRDSAARGLSRTATAAALEMRFEKFCALLDAMPPLDWPAPGQSLDARLSREARRGYCHPSHRENLKKAAVAVRRLRLHTVRGVEGTVPELIKHFGLKISRDSVARRRRQGLGLEEALFTPPIPPAERRRKKIVKERPAPQREPLSAWERVDLEFGGQAPQCM